MFQDIFPTNGNFAELKSRLWGSCNTQKTTADFAQAIKVIVTVLQTISFTFTNFAQAKHWCPVTTITLILL